MKFQNKNKKNNLKIEKNVKKLLLCYYDTPIFNKEFGDVICDVNNKWRII